MQVVGFPAYLFAVRRHEVETTGGDVQVDRHASKLQIALPQDVGQSFGWWLTHNENSIRTQSIFNPTFSKLLVNQGILFASEKKSHIAPPSEIS